MSRHARFGDGFVIAFCCICIFATVWNAQAAPVIIDHHHTDITMISQSAIEQAKSTLHIAYGHTSHGSQLTTGMTGLVDFANGGGLGLSLPTDIFAWNNGGTGGALDLHDYAMGGDAGYYPQWVDNTRSYLNNPANADVNVIIWSWCGQVDDKYSAGWNSSGANRAPVLQNIGDQQVECDQLLAFTIAATDADRADTLTYSASPLPGGAVLDETLGTFSWTPAAGDEGTYQITFTVTDNGSPTGSDQETITITVYEAGNTPPDETDSDGSSSSGCFLDSIRRP